MSGTANQTVRFHTERMVLYALGCTHTILSLMRFYDFCMYTLPGIHFVETHLRPGSNGHHPTHNIGTSADINAAHVSVHQHPVQDTSVNNLGGDPSEPELNTFQHALDLDDITALATQTVQSTMDTAQSALGAGLAFMLESSLLRACDTGIIITGGDSSIQGSG